MDSGSQNDKECMYSLQKTKPLSRQWSRPARLKRIGVETLLGDLHPTCSRLSKAVYRAYLRQCFAHSTIFIFTTPLEVEQYLTVESTLYMAYRGATASESNNEDETIIEICRGSSPNLDSLVGLEGDR